MPIKHISAAKHSNKQGNLAHNIDRSECVYCFYVHSSAQPKGLIFCLKVSNILILLGTTFIQPTQTIMIYLFYIFRYANHFPYSIYLLILLHSGLHYGRRYPVIPYHRSLQEVYHIISQGHDLRLLNVSSISGNSTIGKSETAHKNIKKTLTYTQPHKKYFTKHARLYKCWASWPWLTKGVFTATHFKHPLNTPNHSCACHTWKRLSVC